MQSSTRLRLPLTVILTALLIAAIAGPTLAEEQIRSFHSAINISKDGSMTVLETIRVNCEQDQIRHGIYRDFPTRYKDRHGRDYVVGFKVLSVTRDGSPEPYHFGSMPNGVRVYIGNANTLVPYGEHAYMIQYKTDRQLGFFADHDELYWNVTGNGWMFPIRQASAVVSLPPGIAASDIKTDGWTGSQDSIAKNLKSAVNPSGGGAVFYTTAPLGAYQGLTIALSWPKGVVSKPTRLMDLRWFVRDNRGSFVLLLGLIVVSGYFIWAQNKVGIDPPEGAVVPQWEAPDGLSPAAIRYISRMGYDNKTITAALIDAAIKGYIEIDESDGEYTIKRKGDDQSLLASEEADAIDALLGTRGSIKLRQSNNAKFRVAIEKVTLSLESQFGKGYFSTHRTHAIVGAILSALTLVGVFLVTPLDSSAAPLPFLTILLAIWTVVTGGLFMKTLENWKRVRYRPSAAFGASCSSIVLAMLAAGEIAVIALLGTGASIPILIGVLVLTCINVLFFQLLKAYTKKGRQLMDKAEGLKLYMQVAEQERLNILNPPDRTLQLFEKLLPFALALGVEQQWSEQFADVLEKAQAEGYSPGWYTGSRFYDGGYSGFASSIGNSFSSAISSAATPPGSSGGGGGGFGGGGSSGGGGGGGGGGGW